MTSIATPAGTTKTVRTFLGAQAAVFAAASCVHAGILVHGYEHVAARTAEGVIAGVLVAALAATVIAPWRSRAIGLAAQGFALLGTLVGLFTIAVGVGPRTAFDLSLHAVMVLLLVTGLLSTGRPS